MGLKKPTLRSKWHAEVQEIRTFLEETYSVSLPGKKVSGVSGKMQVAWGRTGVEKFCYRMVPQIHGGGPRSKSMEAAIRQMCSDAVTYGNSTAVVTSNGKVRITSPGTSFAHKDIWGNVTLEEKFEDGTEILGYNGELSVLHPKTIHDGWGTPEVWEPLDGFSFTIFYNHSANFPSGRSRLTPAIRNTILAASRNKLRIEESADNLTFPQRILNGIWEDLDTASEESIAKLATGRDKIIGLPLGPNGEKISVDEFTAASIAELFRAGDQLAREVSSAFNIDPGEMGIVSAVPSSADALYMSKEDIVLEVTAFENSITEVLQNLLKAVAIVTNEEVATLRWANPATPSGASQADQFVKLSAVIPGYALSRVGLTKAGLTPEEIDEFLGETKVALPEKAALPLEQLTDLGESDAPTI
jgi:hypothetical protein